ncbi:unnamed protein product, partial [Effrenium voratum]
MPIVLPKTKRWLFQQRDRGQIPEVKLFALNFCFVYCLPRELRSDQHVQENSDNEVQGEPVFFDKADLATRARAGKVEDEAAATRLCIMTKQMFDLSRAAWKTGGTASALPGPRRAQPGPARPKDEELDHDAIAQAARASRGKSRLPLLPWPRSLNGKQLELLRVVVERVLVELELVPPDHEIALRRAEPLAWLLHGPPGAGKSHVLKFLRELFEEQLGYAQGIDYEVAAFQAVNAADIRGRTLHNACGLGVDAAALDRAVSQEAAKRMSYWRWLVVDEISMVNVRLLAQVEQRLRAVVPSASQWKRGVAGESRPFAGVNVLLLGDFYQLPPPSGGYLADVPSSRRPPRLSTAADAKPDLLADYGRNLVWGGACGAASCRSPGAGSLRVGDEKFRWAAAIVANNDAKYQINKDRAEDYSRAAESPLRVRRGSADAGPDKVQERVPPLGRTALVCRGLAEQLDLPVKGKRSSLGLQWGPVNDANLNGNRPALLAALRCNGDLQVPYRFPVTKETHDGELCQEEACAGDGDVKLLVREAQRTQAGWEAAASVCSRVAQELKDKPAGYVGARVAKRLTTDCYARGVCRGAVECANLTTRAAANDPTAAESVKTAPVHSISLRLASRFAAVVSCPFWTFSGARGRAAQVYELCAFEFARRFRFQQAKRLLTLAPTDDAYHTALTDAGAAKLGRNPRANLQPGVDYEICEERRGKLAFAGARGACPEVQTRLGPRTPEQ